MAERRMLSSKVVCSDAFTSMPFSAQALYVQLVMEADDDGFTNKAKRIQRSIEATGEDLNLLFNNRFILGFENGVVVIKHWRINNQIRKDRYTPTQYQDEFNSLVIQDDGSYTEREKESPVDNLATTWQPDGNHLATQVSLGKDSIVKFSIDKGDEIIADDSPTPKADYQSVIDLYHSICISFPKIRSLSDARRKAIKARLNTYSLEDFKAVFENAENSDFLKGSNDRNWTATFDWLIKDANMAKVLEGNYANKGRQGGRKEKVPGWMEWKPSLGDAELEAIQRVLQDEPATAGTNPDIAARAENLKQRLGG